MDNIRKQFGITENDYPLNIFELCDRIKNVDIEAVPFKTSDLRGLVSIARNGSENHVILVNSNKRAVEQNFHGFHELMHIPTAGKPGDTLSCYDKVKPAQDGYIEWLANEGAAEFLVPYKTLLPMIRDDYDSMNKELGTYNFCERSSEKFGVSSIIIQNRIESLKYEIFQYINGVSIDDIEILSRNKLEQRNIKVKSLVELENERLIKMFQAATG